MIHVSSTLHEYTVNQDVKRKLISCVYLGLLQSALKDTGNVALPCSLLFL